MQSRRDQVQAYFFVVGRLVAALMHGRPDAAETPNRRLSTGTVLGAILGALLVGIFGIYGLFVPGGNSSWKQPGVIIIEKETGARYVYLNGQLRPVLNYASARLLVGGSGAATVSVSQSSLTGATVGLPVGIPGAPDSLPAASRLDSGRWTMCTQATQNAAGGTTPTVTLLIDSSAGVAAPDDRGVLVSSSDGMEYLVWRGKRYRLADQSVANALGYGDAEPLVVTPSWLNPIPVGPDLAMPRVAGRGRPGPTINGQPSTIGQVYEVKNPAIGSDEMYLVSSDGMVPLSRTAAALLLSDPGTRSAYPGGNPAPVQAGPNALIGVRMTRDANLTSGYPPTPPTVLDVGGSVLPCIRFNWEPGGITSTELLLLPRTRVAGSAVPTSAHTQGAAADQVSIAPGSGVLARDLPAPGATPGTEYLITETGLRYPLSDVSVASTLGYGQTSVVNMPNQLLAALPTGPVLDPTAALVTQQPTG